MPEIHNNPDPQLVRFPANNIGREDGIDLVVNPNIPGIAAPQYLNRWAGDRFIVNHAPPQASPLDLNVVPPGVNSLWNNGTPINVKPNAALGDE